MNEVLATTKVYKNYQTAIPKEIRAKIPVDKNTVINWTINEKGNIELELRHKMKFNDMRGAIKLGYPTNVEELEEELYK